MNLESPSKAWINMEREFDMVGIDGFSLQEWDNIRGPSKTRLEKSVRRLSYPERSAQSSEFHID